MAQPPRHRILAVHHRCRTVFPLGELPAAATTRPVAARSSRYPEEPAGFRSIVALEDRFAAIYPASPVCAERTVRPGTALLEAAGQLTLTALIRQLLAP